MITIEDLNLNFLHLNLMMGHWCPIIHRLNPKACVNVKNDQLKAIKVVLRLSQCHVLALMFKVGFYFRSLTITKPMIKEIDLFGTLVSRHKVHLSIQHNNKGHHEKKSNLNNVLLLLLGLSPKYNYGFSIPDHFFGPVYHACTHV